MDRDTLSETELDNRLIQADPVDRAALDAEDVRTALASIRLELESGAGRESASRRSVRPVYRRRWAKLGAASATLAVASLVGAETLIGGAAVGALPLAVSPAAAAQLVKVAHAAAQQPTLGAGQFEFLAYRFEASGDPSFGSASVNYTYDLTVQDWNGSAPTHGGRELVTLDGISFASAQDQASYLANKAAFEKAFNSQVSMATGGDPTAKGLFYDHLFSPRKPERLGTMPGESQYKIRITGEVMAGTERPDGPQALLAELTTAMDSEPTMLWGGLTTILRESTDAQLRATAYEALSYVPDTTVLGNVKDQLGRAGVAIRFTGNVNGPTDTMIVSPATGYLLETDTTIQTAEGPVVEREIDLQHGIVDSVTALPDGGSQPITTAARTVDLATGTISAGPPAGAQPTTGTVTTSIVTSPSTATTPQTTSTPATTATTPQTTSTPATTATTPQTTSTPTTTATTPQTTTITTPTATTTSTATTPQTTTSTERSR
jgi:hypothetical protein